MSEGRGGGLEAQGLRSIRVEYGISNKLIIYLGPHILITSIQFEKIMDIWLQYFLVIFQTEFFNISCDLAVTHFVTAEEIY